MDATFTVGDAVSIQTGVSSLPARAALILANDSDTLEIRSFDPDVWQRLERACRALYQDHTAAISPPPKRAMVQ